MALIVVTQDALDPVPTSIIKEIVKQELLSGGDLSELFLEFDEEPLGSASIAQVNSNIIPLLTFLIVDIILIILVNILLCLNVGS